MSSWVMIVIFFILIIFTIDGEKNYNVINIKKYDDQNEKKIFIT